MSKSTPQFHQPPCIVPLNERQSLIVNAYQSVLNARGSQIATQFLHEFGATSAGEVDPSQVAPFQEVAHMLVDATD